MKRNDFINLFKSDLDDILKIKRDENKNVNLFTSLYILSKYEDDLKKALSLNQVNLMGLDIKYSRVTKNYVYLDLNELYDQVMKDNNLLGQNVTLYRIENKDGKGIITLGCSYLFGDRSTEISKVPYTDPSIAYIFVNRSDNHNGNYKNKWKFAFRSLEDLKDWIKDKNTFDSIKNNKEKFIINEICIPEKMVINGEKESIFESNSIRKSKLIKLDDVEFNFKNKNNIKLN